MIEGMLEDFFVVKEEVNDKTFKKEVADMVGLYTSPDGADVATITAKVDKDLFIRYDVLRRLFKRTRRQDLEQFMRWSIERCKSESKGLETFFAKDKEEDEDAKRNHK